MASAEDVARALSALAAAGNVAAFANVASNLQASTSAQNASLPQYSVPGPGLYLIVHDIN
jgi:hypothetical protein